ncbi:MAG: hypothetical protein NTZ65_01130 [Candidatus Berkelbacteria bacterium]|nr:hypothetical protein [Candidatus Berkelbacteria bacterium]
MPEENMQVQPQLTDPKVRPDKIWKALALIIVSGLVFGGIGYWYGTNNPKTESATTTTATVSATAVSSAKTATTSAVTSATTSATSETASWKNYSNTKYGFSLTFNDNWKNFQVVEAASNSANSVADLYVCVPTTSTTWTDKKTGMFCPFAITVATLAEKAGLEQQGNLNPTYIAENSSYAFFYFTAQDSPSDGVSVMNDLKNIIATFKAN